MSDEDYEKRVLDDDSLKQHNKINFYLPHELGGAGEPLNQEMYGLFNIYTPDMDLAVIKPKWTTKHDFKVDLPKNKMLEEEQFDPQLEEPGSSLLRPESVQPLKKLPSISTPLEKLMHAKKFEKVVLKEFEEHRLPDLKKTL